MKKGYDTFVQCVCVIGGGGKGKETKEKEHRDAKIKLNFDVGHFGILFFVPVTTLHNEH